MKFTLAFLVALALSGPTRVYSGPVKSSTELNEIFQEFLALVPQDKVVEIFYDYVQHDAEVQKVVQYVQTDGFRQLVKKIESIDDVMKFYKYLQESGLDIYGLINEIHLVIGLPPLVPKNYAGNLKRTGGVAGLIADVKAVLPVNEIKKLYHEKLQTSKAFAELVRRLSSPRLQELVNALRKNPEYQKIVEFAKKSGVDIGKIKDLLASMIGLKFPSPTLTRASYNLHDDLDDFIAIMPTDKMMEIALDYLENDGEFQEAIKYLESDNFRKIVEEVEAMKEARDILKYLQDSGLDAYGFLNRIHDFLGIPTFQPSTLTSLTRRTGGFRGFIDDIKAILPIDKIKALYREKLEKSSAFGNLIKRLSSPQFQQFVDAVLIKDEARAIIKKLKEHNVDVAAIADLLTEMLGLHFPKTRLIRSNDELMADLDDFLGLVPLEEVLDIAIDYVFNDPEVQKAAVYLRSADFRKLAQAAEQNSEFRAFIGYLEDTGLPAVGLINTINDLLGMERVYPSVMGLTIRAGGGVRGMLDAIEAVMPHDKIKALHEYKKANSKAFANMIERLSSPEFQTIVDKLVNNVDFQNLGHQAAKFGVDLQAIVDFFQRVFGIKIPSPKLLRLQKSLEDELKDFVDLVPAREIRRIVVRYIIQDKEVQEAMRYVRSADFKQLVRDLNNVQEYHELLKSLAAAGLDVYTYIDKIHKLIGMNDGSRMIHGKPTAGIAGMIKEIKATLPTDKIKALYHEKVRNSVEFKKLVDLISSDKFQAVTNALFDNKIFQDILHKLQGHGIDLKVIADFFLRIFGITTPPGVIDFRY